MSDLQAPDKLGLEDFKDLKLGEKSPFQDNCTIESIIFDDGDFVIVNHRSAHSNNNVDDQLWFAYMGGKRDFIIKRSSIYLVASVINQNRP